MRQWEDIVRERLEGYESALPEGSVAGFRARREAVGPAAPAARAGHRPARRFPMAWAIAAAAAGLAAVLLLRHPAVPDDGIQAVGQPSAPVAVVADTIQSVEALQPGPFTAQATVSQAVRQTVKQMPGPVAVEDAKPADDIKESNPAEETIIPVTDEIVAPVPQEGKPVENPVTTVNLPLIPGNTTVTPVRMEFESGSGIIAGGGLLAALVTGIVNAGNMTVTTVDVPQTGIGGPNPPVSVITDVQKHHFPFKGGLSVGIPVSEKLRITTGLEYSRYSSDFTNSLTGNGKQIAHYLGIPLRLDRTLARGGRWEFYVGCGLEGDFCMGAAQDGISIDRDGFSFSLLGAGGVQYNVSRRIGLFFEPELSWTLPSDGHTLQTFRSRNHFMFSAATGLRINL